MPILSVVTSYFSFLYIADEEQELEAYNHPKKNQGNPTHCMIKSSNVYRVMNVPSLENERWYGMHDMLSTDYGLICYGM